MPRLIRESECACETCVGMCRRFPCRPLPAEVERMPADVRARLMIQLDGQGLRGITHLQAAAVGHEGTLAPDFDVGFGQVGAPHACTFLTPEGRCELHGRCKPFEGRVSGHEGIDSDGDVMMRELRKAWRSPAGERVLLAWRRERGHILDEAT